MEGKKERMEGMESERKSVTVGRRENGERGREGETERKRER